MPSVLLVHGDAQVRASVAHALGRQGCEVHASAEARAGFEAVLSHGFDLIVWDARLAVLDGESVPGLLRATGFDGPVLALWTPDQGPGQESGQGGSDLADFLAQVCWREGAESDGVAALCAHLPAPTPSRWDGLTFESLAGFDQLQKRYLARLPAQLADLQTACAGQDWAALRRLAHALKGTAACFGLPEVSAAAEVVEAGCAQDDRQLIHNGLAQLQAWTLADQETGSSTRSEGSLA